MLRHHLTSSKGLVKAISFAALAIAASGCMPAPVSPDAESSGSPEQQAAAADPAAAARQKAEQAALGRAGEWLALVDGGQYAESWDHAAPLFQSSTSKQAWQGALENARSPLGQLASRRFRAAQHATSLPGAPEGQYVTVHYDTAFAERPHTREVVTLMLAPDASWRVAGYFIEPEKAQAQEPQNAGQATPETQPAAGAQPSTADTPQSTAAAEQQQ